LYLYVTLITRDIVLKIKVSHQDLDK
jgi:hypothetical protein